MAGGSAALISSQEGSEDNPDVGKRGFDFSAS